jgi:hypothetical protein
MRTFIRKFYQEIIAVFLIAGFWGGIWAYHHYQTYQANTFQITHSYAFNPNDLNNSH